MSLYHDRYNETEAEKRFSLETVMSEMIRQVAHVAYHQQYCEMLTQKMRCYEVKLLRVQVQISYKTVIKIDYGLGKFLSHEAISAKSFE